MKARLICVQTEIIPLWRCDLGKKENLQRIGAATYVIERVFAGGRTPQEAVAEEIITTAKKGDFLTTQAIK